MGVSAFCGGEAFMQNCLKIKEFMISRAGMQPGKLGVCMVLCYIWLWIVAQRGLAKSTRVFGYLLKQPFRIGETAII